MYSTKNFLTARLCLVFLIIFNHSSGFGATSDLNKISITDFKYYRKIYFKKQQLLIYKSPNIKSIFYLSDKNQQDYTKKGNQINLNFKVDSDKSNYRISFLNNKLNYSSKQKVTYFESADNSLCAKTLEDNYLKLSSRSILRSIQSVNVSALVDNNTCTPDQKEKLSLYLSDILTTENAWLSRCYGNESVKKLIEADPNYLNYTGSVYSKYLRLVQKINDNENPIQISCKVKTPGKLGSFEESSKPEKISLDFENLSKKSGSENKLPETVKATLGHELFHYGEQMQTPDNPKISSCINEAYAKMFTDICTESDLSEILKNNQKSTTLVIPTSTQIAEKCAKNSRTVLQSQNSLDKTLVLSEERQDGSGFIGTAASQAEQHQDTQKQNEAVQQKLSNASKPVTQSDFTQPSDSDFATLASNTTAGTKEGSSYTVPANSSFGQVVQKTMNSFANSGNTLTNKLNAAVATTTNTANAATTTLASNNTGTTTTGSTYVPTSSSSKIQTNDSPKTATRMPTSVDESYSDSTGKTSLGSSGQPSEMGGGTAGKNNSFYTGSGNLGNTNAGKGGYASPSGGGGSGGTVSSGGGSTTGGSAPTQKTAQKKQTEGSEMVKTIQSLKAFNTVSGGQYQEIKKYYANPQFLNLLQTYDMRIMVKNPSGQYMAIGVDSKKAKKVFNDDGQILKTVEEKK